MKISKTTINNDLFLFSPIRVFIAFPVAHGGIFQPQYHHGTNITKTNIWLLSNSSLRVAVYQRGPALAGIDLVLSHYEEYSIGTPALIWFLTIHIKAYTVCCSSYMAAEDAADQHSQNSRQWHGADNSCGQAIQCWGYLGAGPKCAKQKHPCLLISSAPGVRWIQPVREHHKVVNGLCLLAVRRWLSHDGVVLILRQHPTC